MTIDVLPPAPDEDDPYNFRPLASALVAALPTFVIQTNAVAVAMNLNSTNDTSASSVLIGTGTKNFTASTGKSFQPGMYLVIADTAAPSTNSMYGQITSYDTGTGALVMNIFTTRGSGTKTAWTISQSAGDRQLNYSYDISQYFKGKPTSSQEILRFVLARTTMFNVDMLPSVGKSRIAATASTTFDIARNGVNFGTMIFAASGTVPTFVATTPPVFSAGDILTVTAPASADATLEDIAFVISGYL